MIDEEALPADVIEHDPGTRSDRRRARRRRRRALALALTVLAAVAGFAGARIASRDPDGTTAPPASLPGSEQTTVLVAMTLAQDPSQQADSLTLFAVDAAGGDPFALFVPAGTLGTIPGQGFEAIGKALTFGRTSLQQVTVENLLGVVIDRTVSLPDAALAEVVQAFGGIEVEVTERILEPTTGGRRELVFPLGVQRMSGPEALVYMTYRGEKESELDRSVRARKVWEALFVAAGTDPARLRTALRDAGGDERLSASDAQALGQVLGAFAAAGGRRAYDVLPAKAVGGGGREVLYAADEPQLAQLVARELAGSLPATALDAASRPKLELRNGNGRPEIGETVAAVLVPAGMKIEVTGNAPRFDVKTTRIVVYGDDLDAVALGNRIRELLGVGSVEIGRRPQSQVDATVVIGKDLLGRKG